MTIMATSPAGISDLIAARTGGMTRPFIIALDGHSGAGKSTLARALADGLDAAIIEGDDFYAGGPNSAPTALQRGRQPASTGPGNVPCWSLCVIGRRQGGGRSTGTLSTGGSAMSRRVSDQYRW